MFKSKRGLNPACCLFASIGQVVMRISLSQPFLPPTHTWPIQLFEREPDIPAEATTQYAILTSIFYLAQDYQVPIDDWAGF
jgi:hypothetical protein